MKMHNFKENQENQFQSGKDQEQEKCRIFVGALYAFLYLCFGLVGMEQKGNVELNLDRVIKLKLGFYLVPVEPWKVFNEENMIRAFSSSYVGQI